MKTSSLRRSMLLPLAIFAFPLFNAHADGGVIHFQGSIVEDGCRLSPQEKSVQFSCSQNGKPVVQTVAFNKLNDFSAGADTPVSTKIRYLDSTQKLAILEVTYR